LRYYHASAPIGSEPVLEDFQSAKENLDVTSANGERNPGDKDKNEESSQVERCLT